MPNDSLEYAVRPRAVRDVLGWMLELTAIAPATPRMLLWILARLLADGASPDALLITADALAEVAAQVAIDGREPDAAGLRSMAAVIGDQAANHIPRGHFW